MGGGCFLSAGRIWRVFGVDALLDAKREIDTVCGVEERGGEENGVVDGE